jgi:hypothetical protein
MMASHVRPRTVAVDVDLDRVAIRAECLRAQAGQGKFA